MKTYNFFTVQLLGLVISLFVLGASFYFQYVEGLEPCPLCIMQRLCVALLLLFYMVNLFVKKVNPRRWLLGLQILIAIFGLYFAGRQLWLQSLTADQLPACLPGLDVMLKYFPWSDIIRTLFLGAAECAEVTWHWLGLSMAAWSACIFAFLLLISILSCYFVTCMRLQKTPR